MTILQCSRVSLCLGGQPALSAVSLAVGRGQLVGLIGPNGAGKSSLLQIMAGLRPPDSGQVRLGDRDMADWPAHQRARRIAYLPQDRQCHWPLPVADLVALGRLPHRQSSALPHRQSSALPHRQNSDAATLDAAAVHNALIACDITELAGRPATQLSGGELARVLLARTLAGQPDWLLADEPTAGLDPYHQLRIMGLLQEQAKAGVGVVVVLHDLALAARFCTRLVLLDRGGIVADAVPDQVLTPQRMRDVYRVETVMTQFTGFAVPVAAATAEAKNAGL